MSTKILALGDSWFHYPSGFTNTGGENAAEADKVGNIIYRLLYNHPNVKNYLYYDETTTSEFFDGATHSVVSKDDAMGCCGEELLRMVRKTGLLQKSWLDLLKERITSYEGTTDTFIILLSGGGNDIAGHNLDKFIQHGTALTDTFKNFVVNDIKQAYQKIFDEICRENDEKKFHFILHGYAYAPVNGKGVFQNETNLGQDVLHLLSPGPWLSPTFQRNYMLHPSFPPADRAVCQNIMWNFIDIFNDMIASLAETNGNRNVHYVDLRPLTTQANPDTGWCNEIHFNNATFPLAANKFYDVIHQIDSTI